MSAAGDATGTETKQVPRWRRIVCAVLVVLVCILAPLSLLAVWTRNTLLNTDQYVDTVGPLAQNAAIQDAVASTVVGVLVNNVDLEKEVEDALPERAAFVAPFVARGIENFARDATLRVLKSDRFGQLWEAANRLAHTQVVAVLTGDTKGDRIETEDGKVVVRLGPVVETVREQLSKLGIDIFGDSAGRRLSNEFVLFQSEDLTKIQGAVDLLDQIAIWLPIVMLVMLAIAIAISPNRRRTILRTAIWVAVGMALVLVLFNVGRTFYLDAVQDQNRDAAAAAYDQILEFLRLSARTAFVVAMVVAIGAWLAGPGRVATRIREGVRDLSRGEGAAAVEPSSLGRFVAHYRMPLRVVVIGIALVVLVALSRVTPLLVVIIAVLVVACLLLIEFLARGVAKDGEPPSDAAPPTRSPPMPSATPTKRSS